MGRACLRSGNLRSNVFIRFRKPLLDFSHLDQQVLGPAAEELIFRHRLSARLRARTACIVSETAA